MSQAAARYDVPANTIPQRTRREARTDG